MVHAGEAVARFVAKEFADAEKIVVLCGMGNNGGDGLVAATELARLGRKPRVLLLGKEADLKGDPKEMLRRLQPHSFVTEVPDEATPPLGRGRCLLRGRRPDSRRDGRHRLQAAAARTGGGRARPDPAHADARSSRRPALRLGRRLARVPRRRRSPGGRSHHLHPRPRWRMSSAT